MQEEITVKSAEVSVYELARRALAGARLESGKPGNFQCALIAHNTAKTLLCKSQESGINKTTGISLNDNESLICVFEDSALEEFFILTTIGVEKK